MINVFIIIPVLALILSAGAVAERKVMQEMLEKNREREEQGRAATNHGREKKTKKDNLGKMKKLWRGSAIPGWPLACVYSSTAGADPADVPASITQHSDSHYEHQPATTCPNSDCLTPVYN